MKIEPGYYQGLKKGKLVIVIVYEEAPFLKTDYIELWGTGSGAITSHGNNVSLKKEGIKLTKRIEIEEDINE
jgi:hypothetical protein